ncbi:MAG: glycoside hydrolase family 26 protein [Dermatophilaceae bacterium]
MTREQIVPSRRWFMRACAVSAVTLWAGLADAPRPQAAPLGPDPDAMTGTPMRLGAYPTAASLGGRDVEIVSVFCGASEAWPSPGAGRDLLVSWHLDQGSGGGSYAWWASGKGDRIATAAANRAAALRAGGVYVRPWAECNADWVDFGRASDFVAAWRRVRTIFQQRAPSVRFVFNPTTDTYEECWDVREVWPGDEYVDLHGLDGYNWARPEYGGWRSFDDVYHEQYARLQACAPLPVWVCEFGCAERPAMGDKGQWYRDLADVIPQRYPQIEALVTFNVRKEEDWRINSSASALSGFTDAMTAL